MSLFKINFLLLIMCTFSIAQEIEPEITLERRKLIILTDENNEITDNVYQIASSLATQLKRYDVIDRGQLERLLKEQKLQHSGLVDQDQAIELGKIAAANEALLVKIQNFGQKGVPPKTKEEDEPKTGLVGWIIKEVVKAEIDKATEDIERYPNNVNTVIDGQVHLIDIETSQSIASFKIHADHTGGVKAKSLSAALNQISSQMHVELKNLYLLSSEVLDVRGNDVTLLLGKNMGVNSGTRFEIITRDEKKILRNRNITIPGKSVGFIKVETVSIDACKAKVLRKWDKIEPGYQAHEITDGIFTGGISLLYGNMNENKQMRLFGNIKPFGRFGGEIFGNLGLVRDSRNDDDLQFGLGFSLNFRLMKTSSFSLGPAIILPFDFHMRSDDENEENGSHLVFLPIMSPRLGIQSEIMVSPKIDLVIRGEYVLASTLLGNGHWTYTEEQDDDDSVTWNANWDEDEGPKPKIDYQGWIFSIGIRSTFFSSFTFD